MNIALSYRFSLKRHAGQWFFYFTVSSDRYRFAVERHRNWGTDGMQWSWHAGKWPHLTKGPV